jgi:hypothetical protein
VVSAAARCVELWADEDAATTIGDRRAASRALARTALLTRTPVLADRLTLAATGGDVPARVRALMAAPRAADPAASPPSPACCSSCARPPSWCSTVGNNSSNTPATITGQPSLRNTDSRPTPTRPIPAGGPGQTARP